MQESWRLSFVTGKFGHATTFDDSSSELVAVWGAEDGVEGDGATGRGALGRGDSGGGQR